MAAFKEIAINVFLTIITDYNMDVYFSKQSLSHFKVDEENRQIIVCLVSGENLIVESFEHFREYTETLRKMLKEYESYCGVARYDTNTKKLYF